MMKKLSNQECRIEGHVFDAYAAYYDLLYADKDYEGEAAYIDQLIQQHKPGANSTLELGAGTGKHARLLANAGYRVHGVERSASMLARSAAEINGDLVCELSFSNDDIRTVRLDETFDVVISLFHVMSYMTTNDDLIAAISTASAHLDPGGIFVFDFWYGPAVLVQQPSVRVKRVSGSPCELIRIAEPTLHSRRNCVNVHYDVFIKATGSDGWIHLAEDHLMRYWFEPELMHLLNQQGFQIIDIREWMTETPPNMTSWGACMVAKLG